MASHFFVCEIDPELRATHMEGDELANGMRPVWVGLLDALAHNRAEMPWREATVDGCHKPREFGEFSKTSVIATV